MSPTTISRRFPRQQRLTNATDFKYVFDQPSKTSSRDFTMLARVNHRPYARLGLGVPKRQIRRATARNRIKRLIRESFRHDQLKLTGLDIVVLVRGGAVGADNLHILAALSEQWDKLRQQCEISS